MTLNTATIALANQIQNPALTTFSKTVALITEPINVFILAILIAIALYINRKKSQAILLATTAIITALIITILKNIIQAPRPTSMLILETGYSFPSGHTTFAVVFFGLLAFIFAKKEHNIPVIITSTILILTIAFTRLYLQVHWLTDIIGGLIIGTIILVSSISIYKKEILKRS
jgi:undecaprenyl-diphosphatase